MKILLLNQFYPPDTAPTGQFLHDLARALLARGHDARVICSRRAYEGGGQFPKEQTLDGVNIRRVAAFGFGRIGSLGRLADYTSFCSALLLRLLCSRWRPDLIVALSTPPYIGLLAKVAAKLRGCAHAHWVMDLYPDAIAAHGMLRSSGWIYRILQGLARRQYRGATAVIALGPFVQKRVAEYCSGTTVECVPLWANSRRGEGETGRRGEEDAEAQALRRARGWRDNDLVLMYSGNMGLGHRFQEFLAAAEQLGAQGPVFAFAGGGARRREIEAFAGAHPAARIQFVSAAPKEQLAAHLASADVHLASLDAAWQGLIVPSKIQGIFGAGRPVLFVGGRDNEIASWIEQSGGGWVVAENDVAGLLRAIAEASDPAERHKRGSAARQFASTHFDANTNCEHIVRVLEQPLNSAK